MAHSDNSSVRSLTMSLDFDVQETASKTRSYPSIKDYYLACSTANDKPIQLQKGLSNFSSLKLGDDRISVSESVISEAYRLPMEEKLTVDSPSKHKSALVRKREYADAKNKVGDDEIDRLELVMKDKLIQRSSSRSSPFQVRKAFKFFDREHTNRISIEGFTKALESLGFQFSEFQNLALFARYDPDFIGTIDYMEFITKAMYYDAADDMLLVKTGHFANRLNPPVRDVPDFDPAELIALQEAEIKKVFSKIDKSGRGVLDSQEFEILLMALGYHINDKQLASCLKEVTNARDGKITFTNFFNWWISDSGNDSLKRK